MKGLGSIAFIVGLILAAIIALFSANTIPAWSVFLVAILGIIVGLLNIAEKEVQHFLIASVSFLISFQALSNVFTTLALGWRAVSAFFSLMSIFVAPAAAIVAVVALYNIVKD